MPRPFWQRRFYDFSVFTDEKRLEKRRYMHRNPVVRGLVEHPKEWAWSSYRHWDTGVDGAVEIESPWIFARRMELERRMLVEGRVLETHISESRYGAPIVEGEGG